VSVFLVGAGPGDPDLLTLRGARVLSSADVVVVDRLVDPRMLELARADARIVDVGKYPGAGSAAEDQAAINELLIAESRAGSLVVRLKGGDPNVFGRGAEEVAALTDAGEQVVVIPGITSAIGVPGLAGIPVTARGESSVLTVVSGHRVDDDDALPYNALAALDGTLVLLMAVEHRARIAQRLIEAGMDPRTPVGAIERGATSDERRVATTLAELGMVDLRAPAVIVVGAVAAHMGALGQRGGPSSRLEAIAALV
jgi:uroporphyrin-III C-methyltransferase